MADLDNNPEPSGTAVTYLDDPNTRPHLRERELTISVADVQHEVPWHDEVEVSAVDSTPIPYDPIEAAKLPPVAYDQLRVYGSYSNDALVMRLSSLGSLISALTELRDALRS